MKIIFDYNKEKDAWCLLTYGKKSNNESFPTKLFNEFTKQYGISPTYEQAQLFITKYLAQHAVNTKEIVGAYEKEWGYISEKCILQIESIFKVEIPYDITTYFTTNGRQPYSIPEHFFFVSLWTKSITRSILHELFHFYTWHKFGSIWEVKLGAEKYNEIKEALTVLINIEFKDIIPEGVVDNGYPQHKELRDKIAQIWNETKDIEKVWSNIITSYWLLKN